MNILPISYYNNSLVNRNLRINFGNNQVSSKESPDNINIRDGFWPKISEYDIGIKDSRLQGLIVQKRENMLQYCLVPPEYIYTDEDGVNRLKPHLYIKYIVVKPEFLRQGVSRDVAKRVVELSKKEGFEGRVLLDSSPIKGTRSYISNPAIAHWANGFRFYGKNDLEQMLSVLNGERPPEEAPGGTMYYPIL